MAWWTSRRFSTSPDRLGFLSVGQRRRSLDCVPLTPIFSFYMCAARRGPTSLPRAGRPRSGRESRPVWSVGPKRWRSTLTFSPLISFRILTYLNLLLSSFLILYLPTPSRISAYEHASSSRLIVDRLNNYNTPLGSKIGTLTLGPLSSKSHRLYHEPMSTVCTQYTLGGKPLISRSANTCPSFIFTMHFNHDSGLSLLQRITLCQCVWHHT